MRCLSFSKPQTSRMRKNHFGGLKLRRSVHVAQQENNPAGCSKRLFSKAAASEEAKGTLRYVEPLSDARTLHGNRRVSARQGRAGEKSDFFSILLEFPCHPIDDEAHHLSHRFPGVL